VVSAPLRPSQPWWVVVAITLATVVAVTRLDPRLALGASIGLAATLFLVERSFRTPTFALVALVACLPFERLPSVELAGVSLRLTQLVGLIGLVTVALKLGVDRWRLRPYPAAMWLIGFFAAASIGLAQAGNPSQGVKVFLFSLFTALVSGVIVQLLRTTADLKRVLVVLAASTSVVILFALYQTVGDIAGLPTALTGLKLGYTKVVLGFPRPMAFSIEPLYLANFLFLPLGVFGAQWLGQQEVRSKKQEASSVRASSHLSRLTSHLLGPLILGILLVIALTISRGAWLAIIPFTAVLALLLAPRFFTVRAIGSLLVSLAIVGVSTVGFLAVSRPDALAQFAEHAQLGDLQAGESTQGRLTAFREAVRAWQEHPVVGIGLGNFGSFVKGYPDPRAVAVTDIVNNEYLEVLAETGLAGFVALGGFGLALLARHAVALVRSRDAFCRSILVGLLAAFVATLAQYTFFSTLYVMHVWVLIGLMVAVQNLVLVGVVRSEQ
jgi:O-antigen ligase